MSEYSEKLKDPRWQRKRLEIFQRDDFKCKKCKDTKTTLCVHHKKYDWNSEPWEYDNEIFDTLCEDCHTIVENLKNRFAYNDILIEKLSNDEGDKFIIVTHGGYCNITIKENNILIKSFILGDNALQRTLKALKKSLPKKVSHGKG